MRYKTAKADLCHHLLKGETLNVRNAHIELGVSNISREIGRSVVAAFGISITKKHMVGKSRYGKTSIWTNYSLQKTDANKIGIAKMREYIQKNKV